MNPSIFRLHRREYGHYRVPFPRTDLDQIFSNIAKGISVQESTVNSSIDKQRGSQLLTSAQHDHNSATGPALIDSINRKERRIDLVRAEMAESNSRGGSAVREGLRRKGWQGRGGNRSPSTSAPLPPSTSMIHDEPQSNPQPQLRSQRKDSKPNPKFQKKVSGNSKPKSIADNASPPRIRPTHFLALPLHNHPTLRDRISSFQDALFATPFDGSQITIDSETVPESLNNVPQRNMQDVEVAGETKAEPVKTGKNTTSTDVPASKENGKTKGKPRKKHTVSPIIQGLDTSIVIDPRRMHMTLGVMALELDVKPDISKEEPVKENAVNPDERPSFTEPRLQSMNTDASSSVPTPTASKKTISTALALLASLKPRISEILDGSKGVSVPLETMHILKTTRISASSNRERGQRSQVQPSVAESDATRNETGSKTEKGVVSAGVADRGIPTITKDSEPGNVAGVAPQKDSSMPDDENLVEDGLEARPSRVPDPGDRDKVGAGVLYIAPRMRKLDKENESQKEANEEYRKLVQVCELINKTIKDAGYLTDTRPLTLHCTILNASHRKPARRIPFSYTDILASEAIKLLGVSLSETGHCESSKIIEPKASHPSLPNIPAPSDSLPKQNAEDFTNLNAVVHTIVGEIEDSTLPGLSTLPNPLLTVAPKPKYRPPITIPPPLSVDLGTVRVNEVQIWEMGSHGPNNEYVNCGGIVLE